MTHMKILKAASKAVAASKCFTNPLPACTVAQARERAKEMSKAAKALAMLDGDVLLGSITDVFETCQIIEEEIKYEVGE